MANIILSQSALSSAHFSLFAHGLLKTKGEHENSIVITLQDDTVAILRYTYEGYRRAYIIAPYYDATLKKAMLPAVISSCHILAAFRGQRISFLRNAVFHLSNLYPDFFSLPPRFFLDLGFLINSKNSYKSTLLLLLRKYVPQHFTPSIPLLSKTDRNPHLSR